MGAELRLPAPCLVVLVGAAASGKSTWAAESFRPNEVVSSDAVRAMVGIDERDRAAGNAAFDLVNRIVAERMERKLTTVVDTLGFDRKLRTLWIEGAHLAGLPAHAILFDTPGAVCEQRNQNRGRPVPKTVLRKQVARMKTVAAEVGGDAFDGVHTQQPVAVVSPDLVPEAQSLESAEPSAGLEFGLLLSRFDWPGDATERADQLSSIARRAEKAGFSDVWVMDHFQQIPQLGRPWEEMPESYTTLSYLAGVTDRIRLGSLVTGVTYRNPAHLGKIIATLDVLSGGRAICGIGAAWHDEEHQAYGWNFPPLADRYALLEDTLEVLPLLWGKGAPEFVGRMFEATELICYPRPIQEHIPILVGGSGRNKTLRLVARYADMCNLFGDPDVVAELVTVLHEHCAAVDRDPATISVTNLTPALVAEDGKSLNARIDELRPRDTTSEDYARNSNAGTIDDHVVRVESFAAAGVDHPIVVLPDVALTDSIETFGAVIDRLR